MIGMLNEKVRKMSVVDIGLVKSASFFFAILMAKIFPILLTLSYPILILVILSLGARPLYKMWFQREMRDGA